MQDIKRVVSTPQADGKCSLNLPFLLIIFEASKWVENNPASPGRWEAQLLDSLHFISTNSLRHIWGFEHAGLEVLTDSLGRLYFSK